VYDEKVTKEGELGSKEFNDYRGRSTLDRFQPEAPSKRAHLRQQTAVKALNQHKEI
jgi:hypothetical protein